METNLLQEKVDITQKKKELERKKSGFDFSCGSNTADLHLCDDELADVHFGDLRCEDAVERLYYSMGLNKYVHIAPRTCQISVTQFVDLVLLCF